MRVSTMTNLFYRDKPPIINYVETIKRTNEIGFKVIDFNMCPFTKHKTELIGDDWEAHTYKIADEAAKLGVEILQAHLPYPKPNIRNSNPYDEIGEKGEFMKFCWERSLRISSVLGVKWAVVHPVQNLYSDELDYNSDIKYNHEIYDETVELAASLGVGIAFENMADIDGHRRFGSTPDELIGLIESYKSENVMACWDFGHGNRCFNDQTKPLMKVGKYLRVTHVDDNIGKDDLHTIPYFGLVPWNDIMKTLKLIDYKGDFNFELSCCRRMPEPLLRATVKYVYEVGCYLVDIFENIKLGD